MTHLAPLSPHVLNKSAPIETEIDTENEFAAFRETLEKTCREVEAQYVNESLRRRGLLKILRHAMRRAENPKKNGHTVEDLKQRVKYGFEQVMELDTTAEDIDVGLKRIKEIDSVCFSSDFDAEIEQENAITVKAAPPVATETLGRTGRSRGIKRDYAAMTRGEPPFRKGTTAASTPHPKIILKLRFWNTAMSSSFTSSTSESSSSMVGSFLSLPIRTTSASSYTSLEHKKPKKHKNPDDDADAAAEDTTDTSMKWDK